MDGLSIPTHTAIGVPPLMETPFFVKMGPAADEWVILSSNFVE